MESRFVFDFENSLKIWETKWETNDVEPHARRGAEGPGNFPQ
jgi:hypothetical protein